MISSPKVSPPAPMILTQALEPYEQAASPQIRQNGDIAMPACPGTSPEPLPASSALRLAASHREAVLSSSADPDQLGEVPMMTAPARPLPADRRDVVTYLVCEITGPTPGSWCLPGWEHRVSLPEAGCPGCGRLTAVCARPFPCQARRSRLRWRLAWLRPWPGPSCCGAPGRCSR